MAVIKSIFVPIVRRAVRCGGDLLIHYIAIEDNFFEFYIMEKVIKVIGLHDQQSDLSYWLSKTPQERLAAIEILRQQYVQLKGI